MSRRAIGLLPERFMDQRASARWSKFIAVGGDLNPRFVGMFDEKNRPHQTDRGAAPERLMRLMQIICVEALSFLTCQR
jgi:hypothetical protein